MKSAGPIDVLAHEGAHVTTPAVEDSELWFGALRVGALRSIVISDSTRFGLVDLSLDPRSEQGRAILEYAAFSRAWNERARRDPHRADPTEFARFENVIHSFRWFVRHRDGSVTPIEDAPVFFARDEVTWKPARH